MRVRPLQQFAALPEQVLATRAANAATVGVDGVADVVLIDPRLRRAIRFAHVRPDVEPTQIADPARQRDYAVVREHVAIQRIERRVVDVGCEHAFPLHMTHDDRSSRVMQSRTSRLSITCQPHSARWAPDRVDSWQC